MSRYTLFYMVAFSYFRSQEPLLISHSSGIASMGIFPQSTSQLRIRRKLVNFNVFFDIIFINLYQLEPGVTIYISYFLYFMFVKFQIT